MRYFKSKFVWEVFLTISKWSLPIIAVLVFFGYVTFVTAAQRGPRLYSLDNSVKEVVDHMAKEVWTTRNYAFVSLGLFLVAYLWMLWLARKTAALAADLESINSFVMHSSRSPLELMHKNARLALNGEMETRNALVGIEQASEARLKVVEDYENVSRRFVGYTHASMEDFDLVELAENVLGYVSAGRTDIEFRRDFPSEPVVVHAHRSLLAELMGNLLDNAVKYTGRGVVSLAVSLAGKNVRIVVSDTGRGMTKEVMRRMYDRCYRAEEAKDMPGNGLGLAMVAAIVSRYHGKKHCDSVLGKGTTFTITLPISPRL